MVDAILGNLHSDKRSLKACSLVCKAWTYPARLQLFSELTICPTDDAESHLREAAMFPFVRRLNVKNRRTRWHSLLPQLIGLKRITSLHLSNIAVDCWNSRALSAPHDLSRVVVLSLEDVFFINVIAFAQFICAFPYLQTLSIEGAFMSTNAGLELPLTNAFRLSPDLVSLEVRFIQMDVLLEWFLSLAVHPAFCSVCLHDVWKYDVVFFGKFLAALGDSMKHFSFSTCLNDGALSF